MGIHIGEGLILPATFRRERLAVLGQSGSGKTNLVYVVFEALVRAGTQVILLDPPGVGWGLTLDRRGKANDLPVIVLGGAHGDIPIVSDHGREIADMVMDRKISVVVDLTGFDTEDEQRRFCRDFIRRVHRRKITMPGALHVVFDEVQDLAPAEPESKDHAALKGTVVRFCKQIRNYGAGWTIASQQPQAVHYSVRSQASAVFALHTENEGDFDAILRTINRKKDEIKPGDLEALAIGSALVYCPRTLGREIRRVEIRYRDTFDVPKAAEGIEPMPVAAQRLDAKELEQLRSAVSATVAEAERNDPAVLRSKLEAAERRAALAEAKAEHAAQVPALDPRMASRIAAAHHAAGETLGVLRKALEEATASLGHIAACSETIGNAASMKTFQAMLGKSQTTNLHAQPRSEMDPRWSAVTGLEVPVRIVRTGALAGKIRDGHDAPKRVVEICEVLAEHPALELHESKVAMLIGMSAKGGGYAGGVKAACVAGYISRHGRLLRLEPAGRGLGGGGVPRGLDNKAVIERHRRRLPAKAVAMLEAVERSHPAGLNPTSLALEVGMAVAGGGFAGYLSQLRARGLVVTKGGTITLGEAFERGTS